MERMQAQAAAQRAALAAQSPTERAAAARQGEAARYVSDESGPANALRVELAGQMALTTAEKELADAKRERVRSMTEAVESQRLEMSLIGQTITQAEALRMEYQLTTQARAEAARTGVAVSQEELALIREKSRAYGALKEEQAAIAMLRDQQTSIQTLRLELELVGQYEAVRRRSMALLQKEQQIQREGIATNGARAEQLRAQSVLEADMLTTLDRQRDAWSRVQSAGEDAIDGIVDSLASGDLEGALSAVAKSVQELATDNIKNTLKNALMGTNYGTANDLGGVGGIFSKLAGIGNPASNTAPMAVTRGTVCINFNQEDAS
jgi:hypothetical protein